MLASTLNHAKASWPPSGPLPPPNWSTASKTLLLTSTPTGPSSRTSPLPSTSSCSWCLELANIFNGLALPPSGSTAPGSLANLTRRSSRTNRTTPPR
eukprot:7878458-Pyramimonas_sp.AAC.1